MIKPEHNCFYWQFFTESLQGLFLFLINNTIPVAWNIPRIYTNSQDVFWVKIHSDISEWWRNYKLDENKCLLTLQLDPDPAPISFCISDSKTGLFFHLQSLHKEIFSFYKGSWASISVPLLFFWTLLSHREYMGSFSELKFLVSLKGYNNLKMYS